MRLLLVEDEATPAAYLKRGLEREGYAVDVAADGEQGLWLATNQPYDVIVLDILLPKLDGMEVCARLRSQDVWAPVLMLTALDGEDSEASALDSGADDYLRKPFAFSVLLARVRALIRRGNGARPAVLSLGTLELDPAARRVVDSGRELGLTATEFCILEALLRRPDEVISKPDLLDSCWDWAFDGDPNIVEVYVSRLRRKLQGSSVRIDTVKLVGYRITVDG